MKFSNCKTWLSAYIRSRPWTSEHLPVTAENSDASSDRVIKGVDKTCEYCVYVSAFKGSKHMHMSRELKESKGEVVSNKHTHSCVSVGWSPKDHKSVIWFISSWPISLNNLIIKTPSSEEWWISSFWKNGITQKSLALTASPKQLILPQSDGISPTMFSLSKPPYLWSKSRGSPLWEHEIVAFKIQCQNTKSHFLIADSLFTVCFTTLTITPAKKMKWFYSNTFTVLPGIKNKIIIDHLPCLQHFTLQNHYLHAEAPTCSLWLSCFYTESCCVCSRHITAFFSQADSIFRS